MIETAVCSTRAGSPTEYAPLRGSYSEGAYLFRTFLSEVPWVDHQIIKMCRAFDRAVLRNPSELEKRREEILGFIETRALECRIAKKSQIDALVIERMLQADEMIVKAEGDNDPDDIAIVQTYWKIVGESENGGEMHNYRVREFKKFIRVTLKDIKNYLDQIEFTSKNFTRNKMIAHIGVIEALIEARYERVVDDYILLQIRLLGQPYVKGVVRNYFREIDACLKGIQCGGALTTCMPETKYEQAVVQYMGSEEKILANSVVDQMQQHARLKLAAFRRFI